MTQPTKRTRRDSQLVRSLILDAARRSFAERGYRASTRDIAKMANVNEVLLYRHFESKALLFEAAVGGPIAEFYEMFEAAQGDGAIEAGAIPGRNRAFVQAMYDLIEDNREIIFSFLSGIEFEPELASLHHFDQLEKHFAIAEESLRKRYEALGREPLVAPDLAARFGFALLVSSVLFRKWIFGDRPVPRAEMIDALDRFTLFGLTPPHPDQAPPSTEPVPPRKRARKPAQPRGKGTGSKPARADQP